MTTKKFSQLGLAASLQATMELAVATTPDVLSEKINMQQIFDEIDSRVPNAAVDIFTTTLGQTIFTLSSTPASAAGVSFYHAGQLRPNTDYTVVGTTVTWLDTPYSFIAGEEVIIEYNDVTGCTAPVTSVFSRVGIVVAAASDYDASQVDNDSGVSGSTVANALDTLDGQSGVTSFKTRIGAVVPVANDYKSSEVEDDSGVGGTTVKASLDLLDAAIGGVKSHMTYADSGNLNYSLRRSRDIVAAGSYRFNFFVPNDFNSLVGAYIVLYPTSGAAGTGKNIDISVEYTNAVGQSYQQYTASDTTSTYDLGTVDTLVHVDISALLTTLVAESDGGVFVDNKSIGGAIHVMGILIVYN